MEYAVKIILIEMVAFVGAIWLVIAKEFFGVGIILGVIALIVAGICYLIWKQIP